MICCVEPLQIVLFRGSKSRNKVSVGEPADGSLGCILRSAAEWCGCESML